MYHFICGHLGVLQKVSHYSFNCLDINDMTCITAISSFDVLWQLCHFITSKTKVKLPFKLLNTVYPYEVMTLSWKWYLHFDQIIFKKLWIRCVKLCSELWTRYIKTKKTKCCQTSLAAGKIKHPPLIEIRLSIIRMQIRIFQQKLKNQSLGANCKARLKINPWKSN